MIYLRMIQSGFGSNTGCRGSALATRPAGESGRLRVPPRLPQDSHRVRASFSNPDPCCFVRGPMVGGRNPPQCI